MRYIDFHCDTLLNSYFQNKDSLEGLEKSMISPEKLQKGECSAQFFAIYMLPDSEKEHDDDSFIRLLRQFLINTAERQPGVIAHTNSYSEYEENYKAGKISAFLTLEDGRAVNGSIEKLENFYAMGVRLISLTWNFANCFGYPNSADPRAMQLGLTGFGKEAVCRMNELGMLVDVSHLSDGGFWDVMNISKAPVIASHSNCRSLSPHQRNLTDEMIKALADKGGVAGLNFCPAFLNSDINCEVSASELIAKHAKYMANCGGIECVAIGTDFDGIRGTLEVGGPDKMCLLWDELGKQGFSERDIELIAYRNAERIIKDVLK